MASDIFRDDERPRTLTKDALLAVIDDMRACIEADDSMEGSITYAWSDEPEKYDVGGVMRFGNSMGQGGMRVLWEMG